MTTANKTSIPKNGTAPQSGNVAQQQCNKEEAAATLAAAAVSASALVPQHAPVIYDLGKHLADVERAYEARDSAHDSASRRNALGVLDGRREALRDLICTMPAQTIQDAAVQIEVAATIASCLATNQFDARAIDRMAEQMERVLFGVLPIVAKAAGINLDAMFWTDLDTLRVSRFAGVGVVA